MGFGGEDDLLDGAAAVQAPPRIGHGANQLVFERALGTKVRDAVMAGFAGVEVPMLGNHRSRKQKVERR